MISRFLTLVLLGGICANLAVAQDPVRYKSAIVALADDPQLRADFETALAAKARENNYDASTSSRTSMTWTIGGSSRCSQIAEFKPS